MSESPDLKSIERALAFIVATDQLKGVSRRTRPVGLGRYENAAEHSWHVCLAAIALQSWANEPVDIDRVIRMLLVHDLGEIDAGDTIVFSQGAHGVREAEAAGLNRILGMLAADDRNTYTALWNEFEAGQSPDARFARAIDRIPPLLQNLNGDCHSWRENNISAEQVLAVTSRIRLGSEALWQVLKPLVESATESLPS